MGFVRFSTHEEALQAIREMNGIIPPGATKALICKFALEKSNTNLNLSPGIDGQTRRTHHPEDTDRMATRTGVVGRELTSLSNVYCCALPLTMTKEEFHTLFEQFGPISSSTVLFDSNTAVSRGIGFARFESDQDARSAIRMMNGRIPPGGDRPMSCRLARHRDAALRQAEREDPKSSSDYNNSSYVAYPYPTQSFPAPPPVPHVPRTVPHRGGYMMRGGSGMFVPPGPNGDPSSPIRMAPGPMQPQMAHLPMYFSNSGPTDIDSLTVDMDHLFLVPQPLQPRPIVYLGPPPRAHFDVADLS